MNILEMFLAALLTVSFIYVCLNRNFQRYQKDSSPENVAVLILSNAVYLSLAGVFYTIDSRLENLWFMLGCINVLETGIQDLLFSDENRESLRKFFRVS